MFVKCQDYRTDSFGRQVGCVLKHPNISFNSKVYVEVSGLSSQTSIQFFDNVFRPIDDGNTMCFFYQLFAILKAENVV